MFIFISTPFDNFNYYSRIKSPPGVAYKSILSKNSVVFYSSKNEKMNLPHEFIFVYPVFHWGNIIEKVLPKGKKDKKRFEKR